MGLCPDCREEGETVAYVGASKAEVLGSINAQSGIQENPESEEDTEETETCDLCEEEYVPEE